MKKKLMVILMTGMMAAVLGACGQTGGGTATTAGSSTTPATAGSSGTSAPTVGVDGMTEDALHDISEQELIEKTGIDLPAPEGATDVVYSVLSASSEEPVAEMAFTLDGKKAYLRAKNTDLIPPVMDESTDPAEFAKPDHFEEYNISGLYFEGDGFKSGEISYCTGYASWTKDMGYVAWIDAAPGVLYNLGMESETDGDVLLALAQKAFSPLQGETDGDSSAQ